MELNCNFEELDCNKKIVTYGVLLYFLTAAIYKIPYNFISVQQYIYFRIKKES